jgi:aerobic-type carbon monoxide dehydrogenase small subunit (CoxS/CutS family)
MDGVEIEIVVNGTPIRRRVDARMHLADFLRNELELTGTHLGCEHGVCGACTILLDGASARACLTLAVEADRCHVETVEGLAPRGGALDPLQTALSQRHGLQCGFCTPGVLMTLVELRRELQGRSIDETALREALSGNLCRCTGYQGIVDAALEVLNCQKP